MSVYDQIVNTYKDTTPHMRVVSDVIMMIDPVDTPLVSRLGLASANEKFKIDLNGYKIELLEDEYAPTQGAANQGTTIATNDTSLTVSDASVFQPGHVILIDSEYMQVKTVDKTNNTIEVYARNYGGTNATHASTATIEIVGMAREEGDDADYVGLVDITAPYNYTSILQKALNISGTMQAISQYAKDDEFAYQANKGVPELLRLLARAVFHGVRQAGTDGGAPRSMGGLGTLITDNTVGAGGAIAKSDVDILHESIMLDGGNPDLLVVHPSVARDMKDLIDSSSFVRVDQQNAQFGMNAIRKVVTQYGELELLMDRWCPVGTAYMLDSRKVGLYTLRPFAWEQLGKTGDSLKGELIGEFSLLVANDKAHGKITGITS